MLDGDHRALVEAVLPVCSRYGLGVAGGYAVKAHGLVERPSEDIDFPTGTDAPVGEIVAELALIAEVKAWALDWSTEIGLDMAGSESWSDDEGDQDAALDE
jgi:hypothetical protein